MTKNKLAYQQGLRSEDGDMLSVFSSVIDLYLIRGGIFFSSLHGLI